MKTLLLLRHAKSDWSNSRLDDHDRPLAKRGLLAAPRVGRLLVNRRLLPDLIVTSTARRAMETAKEVIAASGYAGEMQTADPLYSGDARSYRSVLQRQGGEYARVLLVGHNPAMEDLLANLTGKPARMPTAALAQVLLPITDWRDLDDQTTGELSGLFLARDLI